MPKVLKNEKKQVRRKKKKRRGKMNVSKINRDEKRILKMNVRSIRNVHERSQLSKYQRLVKNKIKYNKRKNRDPNEPIKEPITLEMKRVPEMSIISDATHFERVKEDENFDEFLSYFKDEETPKVLVTTGHKGFLQKKIEKLPNEVLSFVKDMLYIFPNSFYFERKHYTIKEITEFSKKKGFTYLMVISNRGKEPVGLILSHLPKGPTAYFRVSSYKASTKIKDKAEHSDYFPELIMNNFTTRLGVRVGRMLSTLFPQKPEFIGRRVVTFHNQRDFIFFRHHRYQFENKEDVILQEIGPNFTLRVMALQLGTFDPKFGEYEFQYNRDCDLDKRKFFL